MKVCFPVIQDDGMESTVYGHFSSTPLFLIIDTTLAQSSVIANCAPDQPLAGCNPFMALRGQQLDAIVVGGIGDEALRAMKLCGFKVYQAGSASVAVNLLQLGNRALVEAVVQQSHLEGRCSAESGHTCSHHSH